jgi:hypothetical protein
VRAPLTRFASLEGEERDRVDTLTGLMRELDQLVAELDAPVAA